MRTRSSVLFVLVAVIAAACTGTTPFFQIPGAQGGVPTVAVSSPASGATVQLGSQLPVLVTATDATAVSRIDLAADGVVVDSFTTPAPTGLPSVSAELHWTPIVVGAHALTVTAYRPDGTQSVPAVIAVEVVAPGETSTPEPSQSPVSTPSITPTPTVAPTIAPTPTAAATPKPTSTPAPADIDLRLAAVQVVGITNPDGSASLDVELQIKNEGTDPSGPFQVSALCQGTTKTQSVRSVAPGTFKAVEVNFASTDTGTDPRAPRVTVDPGKHVKETDETNNALPIDDPLCAAKPPDIDLRLATVQVVGITEPDGSTSLDVSMLIKNEGTDPSGPFQVSATCQGTTKTQSVHSVAPGTYKAVDVDFKPTDTGSDPNSQVVVDSKDQVKETDETNNSAPVTDPQCAPAP